MGYYMNPVEKVDEVGRSLMGNDYSGLISQLKPNEGLVGVGDRMIFKFAALLYSEKEFQEMYGQYINGMLISFKFYAVPLTEFPDYQPRS